MFVAGKYYLSDYAGNVSGPYINADIALKNAVAGDLLLVAVAPETLKNKKKKKVVDKISIDFQNKEVIIAGEDGAEAELNKVTYTVGKTALDELELLDWETIITDAYKACKVVVIKGRPPVKGEYLNEMLHMQ